MADLKTKPTEASVSAMLDALADAQKRVDSQRVLAMMRDVTGAEPKLWGESIVGFGDTHYRYASGREGDWFLTGFSPRKQALTLYLNFGTGFESHADLLTRLGKHKTGKGCLYIRRLADVDFAVLTELVRRSVAAQL